MRLWVAALARFPEWAVDEAIESYVCRETRWPVPAAIVNRAEAAVGIVQDEIAKAGPREVSNLDFIVDFWVRRKELMNYMRTPEIVAALLDGGHATVSEIARIVPWDYIPDRYERPVASAEFAKVAKEVGDELSARAKASGMGGRKAE
jgi:hypothetical protein